MPWCVNVGYGRPELVAAGAQVMQKLSFRHFFGNAPAEPTIHLANRFLGLFGETGQGRDLARMFSGCSGSDANDTAFKFVRCYRNLRGKLWKNPQRRVSQPDLCRWKSNRHSGLSYRIRHAHGWGPAHIMPTFLRLRGKGRNRGPVFRTQDCRFVCHYRPRKPRKHCRLHH